MARLNEPMVPVDNFDILRRKFLRQNRDIARVNSNQSLRIRGLENECARLLSENLDLRGQVLRLEKEVENDTSQRVADHALQIKEKMEAQLVELGALLAGFGQEPPTKRHSPVTVRKTNKPIRMSLPVDATPPRHIRPPPLSPGEAESLAVQEGRLPPIYETKTFPRRTLGQDEILALQADDSEAIPELGPPPVLRLLHDDRKKTVEASTNKPAVGVFDKSVPMLKAHTADVSKEPTKRSPEATKTETQEAAPLAASPVKKTTATATKTTPLAAPASPAAPVSAAPTPTVASSSRSTGKRKFAVNDENAALRGISAGNENNKPPPATQKDHADGSVPTREVKNPRSIRSLVNRKETSDAPAEAKATAPIRQPLSAKSTNKAMTTPRKMNSKDKLKDDKPKDEKPKDNTGKPAETTGRRSRSKPMVSAAISAVNAPDVAEIHVDDHPTEASREQKQPAKPEPTRTEAIVHKPEADAACPSTPPPPSQPKIVVNEGRDTPPPADISLQGEVSRPSRRSRTSVSYAEPNLRDKMRRPTKELLDAVAGEGKYVQRHSLQHQDEGSAEGGAPLSEEQHEPQAPAADPPKTSVSPVATTDQDPYEFTVASTSKKGSSKSSAKGSRRASSSSSAARDDEAPVADRPTRPTTSRKRASAKRGSLLDSDEDDQADSSYEPAAVESTDADAQDTDSRAASARDRISRRRSMML